MKIKITKTPEDLSILALQLAEAFNCISLNENDVSAFELQILNERTKSRSLLDLTFQVREYRRSKTPSSRRMDPLSEYDLDVLQNEQQVIKTRVIDLQALVNNARAKIAQSKSDIVKIQGRIKKAQQAWKEINEFSG